MLGCMVMVPPHLGFRHPQQRRANGGTISLCVPEGDLSASTLSEELKRRGLLTALDEIAEDGPSAFKAPEKVIEYVMLQLQHKGIDGATEAFRFAARPPGRSSFVSGMALSDKRVSWQRAKFIGGYVSGPALGLDDFTEELRANYDFLLGCATWRFAVVHPTTFKPLARVGEGSRGYVQEFVLIVDEKPVSLQLLYDWGCWCYLIFRVDPLDDFPADTAIIDAGMGEHDGRVRDRGGSL